MVPWGLSSEACFLGPLGSVSHPGWDSNLYGSLDNSRNQPWPARCNIWLWRWFMMMSWLGHTFCITGPLWGESFVISYTWWMIILMSERRDCRCPTPKILGHLHHNFDWWGQLSSVMTSYQHMHSHYKDKIVLQDHLNIKASSYQHMNKYKTVS